MSAICLPICFLSVNAINCWNDYDLYNLFVTIYLPTYTYTHSYMRMCLCVCVRLYMCLFCICLFVLNSLRGFVYILSLLPFYFVVFFFFLYFAFAFLLFSTVCLLLVGVTTRTIWCHHCHFTAESQDGIEINNYPGY